MSAGTTVANPSRSRAAPAAPRRAVLLLGLALVYFASAELGLSMAFLTEQVTPVWPPTGVALAAVLLLGYWTWPGIFAGALAANAIAAEPLVTAAGVAAGNTLEALAGAWLLRRAIGFDPRLGRLGDVLGLVGLAAVVSTTISASIGTASLILTGVQQRGVLASVWWTWWVGDAIGDLVVAPVLLTWAVRPSDRARGRPGEALALAASLGVIAAIVFVGPLDPLGVRPLEYAVFPVVIWAALRFGPRGATTVTLVAAVVAIWGTLQGSGPFATGNPNQSLILVQLYMGVLAVSGLLLAAAVAERSRAEDAARLNAERLRAAMNAARMGSWDYDVRTGRVAWSPTLEAIHGLPAGGFGGSFEAYLADVHPDDRERVVRAVTAAIEMSAEHDIEYRIVRPDGAVRWVHGRGQVRRDAEGRTVGMTGLCTDITERRQAEEIVRSSEERFRALANAAPTIVWTAAPEGEITFANARWFEYCGISPEQNATRWPELVLHPDDRERCLTAWTAALRSGADYEIEVRNRRHDGEYRWFLTRAVPVRDAAGRITEWFGTTTDIHDRKRIEDALRAAHAELRQANRAKDEFLAMLSHELRNPLGAIGSAVSVLNRDARADEQAARAREIIARQVRQLTRLVDDLLDVARLESGKITLQRAPVDLREVVERCVLALRDGGRLGHVQLEVTAERAVVEADPARIDQVVANLLDNAVKYTPAGGHVAVRVACEEGGAVLSVQDTGVGIAADMLTRIFDPFIQVEQSLDRARGGLGLGLALVKRLVELHGGAVSAHSRGPGQGSEFVLRLSLARPGGDRPGAVPDPGPAAAARRVVVVEDNADARDALCMMLRIAGHRVEVVDNGPDALAVLLDHRPDVALIDVGLPGLDGYAVARAVKAAPGGAAIRLVALTGYGQPEDRRRALEAGFDEHVVKPADEAQLARVLAGGAVCAPPRPAES